MILVALGSLDPCPCVDEDEDDSVLRMALGRESEEDGGANGMCRGDACEEDGTDDAAAAIHDEDTEDS